VVSNFMSISSLWVCFERNPVLRGNLCTRNVFTREAPALTADEERTKPGVLHELSDEGTALRFAAWGAYASRER